MHFMKCLVLEVVLGFVTGNRRRLGNRIANITIQSMFEEVICQCERKAGLMNALEN